MAKWVRTGVLDNGLNDIKSNATRMLLIKAYTAGDSYATVTGNAIGSVTTDTNSFTLTTSGADRILTVVAGLAATASAGSGAAPDLHIAFTNGTDAVIWVTDETSNQVITQNNPISFPSNISIAFSQPV